MIKLKNKITIIVLSFFALSCSVNKVYTNASYGNLKTYTQKPLYNGEKETALYISGSFGESFHPQKNKKSDVLKFGSLNIHQSKTHKNFNYYYGIGGTYGNYTFNSELENYFNKGETLHFYNVNLKTGINLTKTLDKFEYSLIGFELLYHNEFGDFINKIKNLPEIPNTIVIAKNAIFSINTNSENHF